MTAPYVRIYYDVADDPRFETVYDNDVRFATWVRLLIMADAAWPAAPPIPASVNRPALRHLVEVAGLVELAPGGRYRIHGMDKEREKRSNWGRDMQRRRSAESYSEAALRASGATRGAFPLTNNTNTRARARPPGNGSKDRKTTPEKAGDVLGRMNSAKKESP